MEKAELIPEQQIGQQTDAEEEKVFASLIEANKAYEQAAVRLLAINEWHLISTIKASCFTLFDDAGIQLDGPAQEGNFVRIDIPGPGTTVGRGFDWVCLEHIEKYSDTKADLDFTLIVARPSKVPGSGSEQIAHFFTDQATSTFIVFRRGNVLSAEVHGRNEVPNTKDQNLLDQTRNLLINGGSAVGMSFAQWHLLTSGILHRL